MAEMLSKIEADDKSFKQKQNSLQNISNDSIVFNKELVLFSWICNLSDSDVGKKLRCFNFTPKVLNGAVKNFTSETLTNSKKETFTFKNVGRKSHKKVKVILMKTKEIKRSLCF